MKKNHLNDVLDDDSARKGDEHGLVEEDWIGVEVLQVKGLRRRRVPEKKSTTSSTCRQPSTTFKGFKRAVLTLLL